jgi:hypothetical protein
MGADEPKETTQLQEIWKQSYNADEYLKAADWTTVLLDQEL